MTLDKLPPSSFQTARDGATAARLEALVGQMQSGILVMDENRRVVLANPQFCRMWNIPRGAKELTGAQSWRVALRAQRLLPDPRGFWKRIAAIVADWETVSGEEIALCDGRTFSLDCAPIFCDGMYSGYVWSLRDISSAKNFERELERTRDLALQGAHFQSEFLANMSHEIRTPINGVLGMLGLLADTPLQKDQRALLQTAQISADALLHIINDILDFSKVKAGKLHIEDGVYTPVAVLDDCFQTVFATAHDKGLELLSSVDADVPGGVRGDGARVRQIITNLLSNAIKFTHRGEIEARIEISACCEASCVREATTTNAPARCLRFSVRDSGIGMSEETQANLFQPFMQADGSTTRRYGGTGLGLAICKQLVERMGGQIGVQSRTGEGSTFWFCLPLEAVEVPDETRAREEAVALCDARVLVVEDNATIRHFLLQQLGSWKITGEGARTGGEALHRLRSAARAGRPYDAAMLDAQLPDMDAFTLARAVKEDAGLSETDLLLITALGTPATGDSPFAATLSKPVRQSQLYEALMGLFGGELDRARAKESEAAPTAMRDYGGVRVLLADDNAINREVALRWLQKWNCQTTPVVSGREAVEALRTGVFDLVLMDCQMAEMDGYEAARAIRALDSLNVDVPIVAVTAHAMEGDREKCLAAGMNDYLPKPVRPDALAELIERWVDGGARTPSALPDAAPAAPEEAPTPLDIETLLELREAVGDDEFPQFVEMFFEQSRECERLLREAVAHHDCPTLSRVAHSLKGVARQYGAHEVALTCEKLQIAAKSGHPAPNEAGFGSHIESLRAVLLTARNALVSVAATLINAAPARPNGSDNRAGGSDG